jgi:hypothetical protein
VTSAGRRWSSRRCTGIAPVVRADGAGKVREGGGEIWGPTERGRGGRHMGPHGRRSRVNGHTDQVGTVPAR